MNTNDVASLKKLFTVSSLGLRIEDRHFYAVYRTRLLRYDGHEVSERGYGDIVSFTRLFPARDKEDARVVAPRHFDLFNPTFNYLNRDKIEKVEHSICRISECLPPNYDNENFRIFQRVRYCQNHFHKVKIYKNDGLPLPESFLGFDTCSIRRIQSHLNSPSAIAYLYHPWHGACDNYEDWFRCERGTTNYQLLEKKFNNRHGTEEKKFNKTEYTNLDITEQELIRKYKRLMFLDEMQKELSCYDYFPHADLMQGRFQETNEGIVFVPKKYNHLRLAYLGREEKVLEARLKIKDLESEKRRIDSEIESLEKFIDGNKVA